MAGFNYVNFVSSSLTDDCCLITNHFRAIVYQNYCFQLLSFVSDELFFVSDELLKSLAEGLLARFLPEIERSKKILQDILLVTDPYIH